jgi:hypothetical protein
VNHAESCAATDFFNSLLGLDAAASWIITSELNRFIWPDGGILGERRGGEGSSWLPRPSRH